MALTVPNTFVADTTILASEVNDNFTALLDALDKRGDTLTGNLTCSSGVTIDGVDISAVIGTGGTLLAVNGAAVTGLNASNLASGTVPGARASVRYQTTQTANYTVNFSNGNHQTILCNTNAFTVTLPTAVGQEGKTIRVVKIGSDANAITLATTSSQTIGAHATAVLKLYKQDDFIEVESNGANWQIVGEKVTLAARARLTAGAQTVATATVTTIIAEEEIYDYGAAYNNATGVFTCPRAGRYRITGSGYLDSGAANGQIRSYKNATLQDRAIASSIVANAMVVTTAVCAASDTLSVAAYHEKGSNSQLIQNYTWVEFEYLGN